MAKEKEKNKIKRQMFCIKYIKMHTHSHNQTHERSAFNAFAEKEKKGITKTNTTNLNALVKMKLSHFSINLLSL